MATLKPRITISLNPHVYATVKRMSQLGGQPMASIISELLESVHEPLMRTVAFLEAAADAPQQVRDGLRQSFEAVEKDLYGVAGYTVSQIDWLTDQMQSGGVGHGGGDALAAHRPGSKLRSAGRESTPVPVTRGSGMAQDTPPTPTKMPRKPVKTRVSKKGGSRG